MINYNSFINSFASRTQNSSPSYSALKKPIKLKPKLNYFHESLIRRPYNLSPIVLIQKKPLNLSPRRVVNIKLPNTESRQMSLSPNLEPLHHSSRSVDLPKAPIVISKLKQRQLGRLSQNLGGYLQKELSQISLDRIIGREREREKSQMRNSVISNTQFSLYEEVSKFISYIDITYKKMYEEIDISQKGFITLDDFINLVMFIELINSNGKTSQKNLENFEIIKSKAEAILSLFSTITKSQKITKKDFYSICSLYEFTKTDSSSLNLLNPLTISSLLSKSNDFQKLFEYYAKEGRIRLKDLHNILNLLHIPDLHQLESMLYLENIDLGCFFRYLPLFSWMHEQVIKSLDYS